jgi:hypothetical protein
MMMKKILVIVLFPLQAFQVAFAWPDEPSEGFFSRRSFRESLPVPRNFLQGSWVQDSDLPGRRKLQYSL